MKKRDYIETNLNVNFGEEKEILIAWKRACLGKFGNGGIKQRVIFLLKQDLKTLEAMKN